VDIGGGYVETFAFDSGTPSPPDAEQYVTVSTPAPIFLLSDLIGSSGAALGLIFGGFNKPEWFAKFSHWPSLNIGPQPATTYSFVDGAALENLGIVPLLRRQYPIILLFVNSQCPIGAENDFTVDGICSHISRLFGFNPQSTRSNNENTHFFPACKFQSLADGLKAAKANGQATYFIDSYPIIQPNFFDIPSYPDNRDVTIVWFYSDINGGQIPSRYYKYGPEQGNYSDHWYDFSYDGITGAEFNGNTITLHFKDDERGDDLIPNGKIVDPGGPVEVGTLSIYMPVIMK